MRSGRKSGATGLLAQSLRPLIERRWQREGAPLPPRNSADHRQAMLHEQDCGMFRKASLARWGIDERDPTTERRFVDFCLSLLPDALLRDGIARPVAREALSDRLPREILDARSRGLQFADWHEQISPGEVRDVLSASDLDQLLDMGTVGKIIDRWPQAGFGAPAVVRTYRMDLMRAVSAASFLCTYRGTSATEINVRVTEESRPLGREKQE